MSVVLLDEVTKVIAGYSPRPADVGSFRRSAVLVPLRAHTAGNGAGELIFTRRAEHLAKHPGQVSFPGGSLDAGDSSPEAGALREANEELAIEPAQVSLVGRLDEMITITDFHVVPVVGVVEPGVELVPDPREVARVFTVPLEVLLEPDAWELRSHPYRGSEFQVWHVPYDGEDIWGVTAIILRGMVELLWDSGVRPGPQSGGRSSG